MAKGHTSHRTSEWLGLTVTLIPAAGFIYLLTLVGRVAGGETISVSVPWAPSLGVELALTVDGLSLLFGLIVTFIGALVFLYAGAYLAGHPDLRRFYIWISLFMLAMLGVVFSRDLIALFVFWELTSLSSYMLIGFYHDEEKSRNAALQALVVTGSGGLGMLAGFLLLGVVGGGYDVSVLAAQADQIRAHPLYPAVLALVLVGAFTKSAQFPFHFWLPNAMAAPAPVSAYLHSATMVKAGVFLLARLSPVLGGAPLWGVVVVPVGAGTMLLAAWLALGQTDLKRILAYSTVSALGMLTFLLGIGTPLAVKAAMVLLVAHALYKAALFLVAGAVDHGVHERDITRLGGLARWMPLTAAAAVLAALSQAGLPPFFGFLSKELLYEVTLALSPLALLTGVALATSVLLFVVAGVVALRPFFGRPVPTAADPHEPPWPMLVGIVLPAALGLLFGLFPAPVGKILVAPAAAAVLGKETAVKLALWHGLTPMLALSGLTVLLGAVGYALQNPLRRGVWVLNPGAWVGPERLYEVSWKGILRWAEFQTRKLQSGSLSWYLLVIILTTVGLVGYPLFRQVSLAVLARPVDVRFYELLLGAVILVATGVVVWANSRLAAVAALGVIGFGVATIYALFGAPDLAMTQFAIETLTVILFVLVLYRLPPFVRYSARGTRIRDAAVALAAGAMMTLLVLVITFTPVASRLTPFFAENSYKLAQGRNVVNVILVDFRGLDTLGEITVLAVAAIGIFALMKLRPEEK